MFLQISSGMLGLLTVEFGITTYGTTQTDSLEENHQDTETLQASQSDPCGKESYRDEAGRQTIGGPDAAPKRNSQTGVTRQYQPRHCSPPDNQRPDGRSTPIQSHAATQSPQCGSAAPASPAGRLSSKKFRVQIISRSLFSWGRASALYNSFNAPRHSCSDRFLCAASVSINSRSNRSNTVKPSSTNTVPT